MCTYIYVCVCVYIIRKQKCFTSDFALFITKLLAFTSFYKCNYMQIPLFFIQNKNYQQSNIWLAILEQQYDFSENKYFLQKCVCSVTIWCIYADTFIQDK